MNERPMQKGESVSEVGEKTKAKGNLRSPFVDPDLICALSHPLRVHIIDVLNEVTASPSDLARDAGLSVNYVAYHVKELERIGFVELVRTEPRRGTVEHFYRAKRRLFFEDHEWEQLPQPIRRGLSIDIFRLILDDARKALAAGTLDERTGHLSSTTLLVDEQGWDELISGLNELLERVLSIQAECAERLEASGGKPISASVSLTGFEMPSKPDPDAEAPGAD